MRFRPNHPLHAHTDNHNNLLVLCFQGLADYTRSCSASPFAATECKRSLYAFLTNFADLHDLWRSVHGDDQHASLPFHLRPKAHLLQHLVEDKIDLFGSPSKFWCYGDEDFVGVIKAVCAVTKHPRTLERRVCEKSMCMAGILNYRLTQ